MKLTIQRLVVLSSVALVVLTAVLLTVVSVLLNGSFAGGAEKDVNDMTESQIAQATTSIGNIVSTQGDLLSQRVDADLKVASEQLDRAGGFNVGGPSVTWNAKEQVSGKVTPVTLPQARAGSTPFGQVFDPGTPVPVVDSTEKLVGDTATIFQRMNAAGDMIRVATNIKNAEGKRNIGTYIAAKRADGTPTPVLEAVLAGKTYAGTAKVAGAWYVTRYAPITEGGKIVGMTYVGVKQESVTTLRDAVLGGKVGENGKVLTLGTTGENKGVVRFSADAAQQGKSLLDVKDADGKAYMADAVTAAADLKPGQTATVSFVDPDGGPSQIHVTHYAPWDWTIAVVTRNADFSGPLDRLNDGRTSLVIWLVIISLLVVAAAVALALWLGRRITRPILALRDRMAEIADGEGDLTARVDEHDENEVGQLGGAFNRFAGKVASTIGAVTHTAQGVTDATTRIASLTRELDATAATSAEEAGRAAATSGQVGESIQGAAAATEEMTASIREIATSAGRAAEVGNEAARLAAETEGVVTTLGQSSTEIGNVVATITSIAEQTNLLALNATIEAARAGEAGKGFAVVAGEVKDLAQETSKATGDIGRRVEAIQADTLRAVEAISQIAAVVRDINDAQATIAAAVEEQSATTAEVSRSVQHAASGVDGIRSAIERLDRGSRESATAVRSARESTDQLDTLVDELGGTLRQFKI